MKTASRKALFPSEAHFGSFGPTATDDDGLSTVRGVANGVLIGVPLWVLIGFVLL
jgi:hypothetical protein